MMAFRCRCCAGRILPTHPPSYREAPKQRIRQLGLSARLRSSGSASAVAAESDNCEPTPDYTKSTFGSGWSKPAFKFANALTDDESRQRRNLLSYDNGSMPSRPSQSKAPENKKIPSSNERASTLPNAHVNPGNTFSIRKYVSHAGSSFHSAEGPIQQPTIKFSSFRSPPISRPPQRPIPLETTPEARPSAQDPKPAPKRKWDDWVVQAADLVTPEISQKPKRPPKTAASRTRTRKLDGPEALSRSKRLEEEYGLSRNQKKTAQTEEKRLAQRMGRNTEPTPIIIPDFISVGNLADALNIRRGVFLRRLQKMGFDELTNDHVLDAETAGLISAEFNFEAAVDSRGIDLVPAPAPKDTAHLPLRPPVVTIMGHVDHGKTTLLDYLRKSSVVATEHGGITQHIGAFSVSMPSGKQITFLDTPGHAAFLEMRKRGADITDIVILVVAADDSVKPQTIEAIKHAKGANVPLIVAINKVDKPDIDIDRVKQDLARNNVTVEDFGGDVQAIAVSGKTGQGMLELEEAAVTLAEMLDLRADAQGNFEGQVIESSTKKAGRVATMLVKRGTLRPGDIIVAGTVWAKVRTLRNEAGKSISEAPPGTPVEVDGWKDHPVAGSEALQAMTEQQAKEVVEFRLQKQETSRLGSDVEAINESRRQDREKRRLQELREQQEASTATSGEPAIETMPESGPEPIPFIVKGDVSGSVETIVNVVSAIGNNEIFAKILRFSVGQVTDSDVRFAAAAQANIISFNQTVSSEIKRTATAADINILSHNIIYELIDDVKMKLSGHLPPLVTQRVLGEAELGQIFDIKIKAKQRTYVAGCKVVNGVIDRTHRVRVLRNKKVVYDGKLSSLKNVKKDVTEMRKGTECGMAFEDWTDFAVGDEIQTYEEVHEKRFIQ
ncbi:hypothetical protein FQN57_004289 [Myotisia sp. PD_48]|nr:hypothetical protein FQN57_004289 [Myotisia sp. PD_48]